MTGKTIPGPTPKSSATRKDRLGEALKANIQRRKAQARARKGKTDKEKAG